MKIYDAHTHIFPRKIAQKATQAIGDFYDIPMNEIGSAEILLQSGAKIGVEKYLVCSSATKPSQVRAINEFISQACKEHDAFIGFGTLHPYMDRDAVEQELSYIKECGLRGIKLHPDFQLFHIDEKQAIPMYEKIAAAGLPVLFHTGDARYDYSSPKRLRNVIKEVPSLVAIAAHFGGYQEWDIVEECLSHGNIYFDTSSSLFTLDKKAAVNMIRHLGVERFMFGTDFPMWDHMKELKRFLDLPLNEDEQAQILYKTFERLFKIEEK